MAQAKPVRIGVIGLGNMGRAHVSSIQNSRCPSLTVTAVCDRMPAALEAYANDAAISCFDDPQALIDSGTAEAVLIATPHFDHTSVGSAALAAGLHVLVEKPISVHKRDCQRLIAAYDKRPNKRQLFAAMFNQRTDPAYRKIKQLIDGGELGTIRRVNWIITNWFRTQAYYDSGDWRATWAGEGGGVLLNQCPHQLDLFQWLVGMPTEVQAQVRLGQWHDIEVEDDVTAFCRYANGATGVFITSTGEAPGTNRLEIVGERGKLVAEDGALRFTRNEVEMTAFSQSTDQGFAKPDIWHCDIPVSGHGGQHVAVMENFGQAIRDRKVKLIAPGIEGIRSVELGNAMLMSGLSGKPVQLPLDGAAYERLLKKLIRDSAAKPKKETKAKRKKTAAASDFAKSFN